MSRRIIFVAAIGFGVLLLGAIPFLVPLHYSLGAAADLRRIRAIEYAHWDHTGLPRNEINAVTVIALDNYAVADTNIDTDNITLYRRLPVGWKRGPDLNTGSYCELRSHGVPVTLAYQLAWRVHWSIGADRYRDSECLYPNVPL